MFSINKINKLMFKTNKFMIYKNVTLQFLVKDSSRIHDMEVTF